MKYFFYISFSLLCVISIVDPGNSIFGLKEIAFACTLVLGFLCNRGVDGFPFFLKCVIFFVGFFFPLYGILVGLSVGHKFELDVGLSYIKSLIFIYLLLVLYKDKGISVTIFSLATLLIVPFTIYVWDFVSNYGAEAAELLFDEDTIKISRRSYGPLILDPCINYKTSPLMIFGLSYIMSKKTKWKYTIVPLVFTALFYTGTRANMLSGVLIFISWIWFYNKSNKRVRSSLLLLAVIVGVVYLPYLINDVFFSKYEPSMDIKKDHFSSYVDYWINNPINFLFGQGLGSGMPTKAYGLAYLIEPTYLEIIRHWGVVLYPLTLYFFILCPAYYFYKSRKSIEYDNKRFFIYAYLAYAFLEIPSNPLLFGSSGMIVLTLAYTVANILRKNSYDLRTSVNIQRTKISE